VATVTVALPAASRAAAAVHKHAVLKAGNIVLTLPCTDAKVTHTNIEPDWVDLPRLGDQPLQRRGNPRMRQMTLNLTFSADSGDVETQLQTLLRIAQSDMPMSIANYGQFEAGFWWIRAMPITSEYRELGTNRMRRATVTLTCVMAALNSFKWQIATPSTPKPVKPITTTGSSHPVAPSRPKTYTVKRGDTLSGIAQRFYGDASKFRAIATANKIKNPNLIYPGQVLKLP
jgi:nucleoid-associated protein YgaU